MVQVKKQWARMLSAIVKLLIDRSPVPSWLCLILSLPVRINTLEG